MSSFTLVTGGYETAIRFFDATNQRMMRTIQFVEQHVLRLAFSSDRPVLYEAPLFLIAGGSPSVAVYDVSDPHTSPTTFQIYQGHTEAITAVGFEPRYTAFAFSASEDGTLQTWIPQLAAHQMPQHSGFDPNFAHSPMSVPIHPMAAGAYLSNGAMRFASVPATLRNEGPHGLVPIHDAVYFPPADLFFTADFIGRLRIWDHKTSSVISNVIPHRSRRNLHCIELSADHSLLAIANFDGLIFIYKVQDLLVESSTAIPITFRANDGYITRIRLSVNASLLVSTSCSGTVKVFRTADILSHCNITRRTSNNEGSTLNDGDTIAPVREFNGQFGSIWDAAFVEDRDDYLFTCSSNRQVMLWSLNEIQNSTPYSGHQKGVVCLAVRERMSAGVGNEQFGSPPVPDHTTNPTNIPTANGDAHSYDARSGS